MGHERENRVVTATDLARVREAVGPLCAWLRDVHGRHDARDGVVGLVGVAIALVGLFAFDASPLVVLFHLVLALLGGGLAARLAVREPAAQAPRPFLSPLHALRFVAAVDAACRAQRAGHGAPGLSADLAQLAGDDRPRLPPIRGFLAYFACVMALFAVPLAQGVAVVFDRRDWLVLGALLAVNAMLVHAAWRDHRASEAGRPWEREWAIEAPPLGHLAFWRHYRLVPLFASFVIALLLGVVAASAIGDSTGGVDFAARLEARLRPIAVVSFAVAGALYLLLLAAPARARRRIAMLDAFDVDDAERRLPRRDGASG